MMEIDETAWSSARHIAARALTSSLHAAIASVDPDGAPHVTPIGSLMLSPEPGRGIYFDVFNARLARNVDADPQVAVLVVDSRKLVWLRALVSGQFRAAPGIRLQGTVGPRRHATEAENTVGSGRSDRY
jgi:hypothetical protein